MNVIPTLRILFLTSIIFISSSCTPTDKAPSPIQEAPEVEEIDAPDDGMNDPKRYIWQRPNLIISLLGDDGLSEMTIADIGAGMGFFSMRLAPLSKKVIALDINQELLNIIDSVKINELAPAIHSHLEARLTPRDAPNLEDNEVDAVLIVNTFMFIENKLEYLTKLKKAIKPGGRIVIVDFKRKRTDLGPLPREDRLPLYQIEDLFYEAGYKNIQAIDTELKYQYILIADK